MSDITLLSECVLPGCHEAVVLVGEPCPSCREAFGSMLVERRDRPGLGAEDIDARDAGVRAAYASQASQAVRGRMRNQVCWLCEERRTCTQIAGRWECDECGADHQIGDGS